MGRIAGVTAEETRRRLLRTAANVFGRRGYDGASISEISSDAGLSSGAIYAHYASKAELFVATLRAHAKGEFERLLGNEGFHDFASFLTARGRTLDRRSGPESNLLIEAIVAARRHPEVADLLASLVLQREDRFVALLRGAQSRGEIDPDLSAEATVRFALMLAMGSLIFPLLDLPPVDHDDWSALVARVVDNLRSTASE